MGVVASGPPLIGSGAELYGREEREEQKIGVDACTVFVCFFKNCLLRACIAPATLQLKGLRVDRASKKDHNIIVCYTEPKELGLVVCLPSLDSHAGQGGV